MAGPLQAIAAVEGIRGLVNRSRRSRATATGSEALQDVYNAYLGEGPPSPQLDKVYALSQAAQKTQGGDAGVKLFTQLMNPAALQQQDITATQFAGAQEAAAAGRAARQAQQLFEEQQQTARESATGEGGILEGLVSPDTLAGLDQGAFSKLVQEVATQRATPPKPARRETVKLQSGAIAEIGPEGDLNYLLTPEDATKQRVEADRAVAQEQARTALPGVLRQLDEHERLVKSIRDSRSFSSVYGVGTPRWLAPAGSGTEDLYATIDQLKGVNFLSGIQQARGTGPISDREGAKIEAAATRLTNPSISEKAARKEISLILNSLALMREEATRAAGVETGRETVPGTYRGAVDRSRRVIEYDPNTGGYTGF